MMSAVEPVGDVEHGSLELTPRNLRGPSELGRVGAWPGNRMVDEDRLRRALANDAGDKLVQYRQDFPSR